MVMVDVDTIAAHLGGSLAQANWLGPKFSSQLALFCIRQVIWVNFCNSCAMMIET